MISISLPDVQRAQKRIQNFIQRTSLKKSDFFSQHIGADVFLKWETEHKIKSFKIRGALNKVFALGAEERSKGIIAASAGNHAQGVALAAHYSKMQARVVMMNTASKVKIQAAKHFGAEVILKGETYEESYKYARSIQGDSIFVHPFADPLIIAGQGTVALEVLEQEPDITSIVCAIGGGGLISGNSFTIKKLKPMCKVYGVVWDGTPSFCTHYHQKTSECHCYEGPSRPISKSGLTDGIAVKQLDFDILKFCKPYVDDVVCVTEEEISKTMIDILEHEKQVVEGSGAASLAAVLKYKNHWDLGSKPCVIISGGNVDAVVLDDLIKRYSRDG